jgi:hypothetical protein
MAGADAICQRHAAAAGLKGTFKAWLATSDVNTPKRLFTTGGAGGYRLVGGATVANDWADLVDGSIAGGINTNEIGVAVTGYVWTQTNRFGELGGYGIGCSGFTTTAGVGRVGRAGESASTWVSSVDNQSCATPNLSLYCFEQY